MILLFQSGCLSFRSTIHTPLLEREIRVPGSEQTLADALVLVFYDYEITPIDYGGPYPLRVGLAEPRGNERWIARDEPYVFTSQLLGWILITSWQNRPVFYAIRPDGQQGFLSEPEGWAVGLVKMAGGAPVLLGSSPTASLRAGSVDRLLRAILLQALITAEPREWEPNRPLIKPEVAVEIARYVEHHTNLFSERTRQLTRRLTLVGAEPPTPDDLNTWSEERSALNRNSP